MIKRFAFKKVELALEEGKIPVLIGLRRIGKTTILEQLKEKNKNSEIISWDSFDIKIMSDLEFFNYIKQKCSAGGLLLFDEVQERKGWDTIIKNLYDQFVVKGICKIVVTGSSSMIISGKEMGVDRTKRIFLDTWNFDEYVELTKKEKSFENFEDFLGKGFPGYMNEELNPGKALNETLKPIIEEDIPRAFPGLDTTLLMRFFNELAFLTNGEVNESSLSRKTGLALGSVRKYIEILIRTNMIKRVFKIDKRGVFPKKKKYKIFINPHIHIWLLGKSFNNLGNKQKGHIIESYWLHWVFSIDNFYKDIYYLKDSNSGKEIDFVSLNSDGSFKTLHEFKYKDKISSNELSMLYSLQSKNKLIWCKETKTEGDIKYISILDMNNN